MATTFPCPASRAALLLAACALASPAPAQAPRSPLPTAVRDVRVVDRADAPRVTLVLRDGRIDEVLDGDAAPPPGCRVVEGEGRLAVPAFLDAYARVGFETPEPVVDQDLPTDVAADVDVDMRVANRKGIQPSFRAADALALEEKDAEKWREQGFGALLAAPHGQLLAGSSALVVTREAAARDAVVVGEVFAHAAFAATGSGYPSTLMGYMAQLRQFFLDARRQAVLRRRQEAGRPGPRAPYDRDLEVAVELLAGERRVLCEAETARDVRRWLRLGAEAGVDVGIAGGREAWKAADELAERRVPVVLTLDWGEEVKDPTAKKGSGEGRERGKADAPEAAEPPEAAGEQVAAASPEPDATADDAEEDEVDWEYEEPLGVRLERRRRWEEGRDGAVRLHERGVAFAFGSGGDGPKKLLARVRTLVENGLPRDAALRALTRGAAELCGVERRLGALAPGFDATFALWTDHPLAKKAQVAHLFVDGHQYEFDVEEQDEPQGEPDEGVDATGTWSLTIESPMRTSEATVELAMEPGGAVTGTYSTETPEGGAVTGDVEGHVAGATLTLRYTFAVGDMEIEMEIEGELDGDELDGEGTGRASFGEFGFEVRGTRAPGADRAERGEAIQ